jgi:hypothetical protein
VACAERGGAYHCPRTASPGNARLAALACRTKSASAAAGSGLWAHARLALCRRNLGNALMLAAAAAPQASPSCSPAGKHFSRGALAAEAAAEYGRAGDALDWCWGNLHRDTAAVRQLEAWAKGFG